MMVDKDAFIEFVNDTAERSGIRAGLFKLRDTEDSFGISACNWHVADIGADELMSQPLQTIIETLRVVEIVHSASYDRGWDGAVSEMKGRLIMQGYSESLLDL